MVCSDIVKTCRFTQFNLLTYFIRLFILGSVNNHENNTRYRVSIHYYCKGEYCICKCKNIKYKNFIEVNRQSNPTTVFATECLSVCHDCSIVDSPVHLNDIYLLWK